MKNRFEIWVESPSDISRIRASGYALVLMDSCFIVEYSDLLEVLASGEHIRATGRIPAVCDFTRHEVEGVRLKAGGRVWRALRRAERLNLCMVRTGFIEHGEPTEKLLEYREYIKAFKRLYAGLPGRSNKEDLALYVTTLHLRDSEVKAEAATIDKALRRALEKAEITVHTRPWIT